LVQVEVAAFQVPPVLEHQLESAVNDEAIAMGTKPRATPVV
jgi:hypothetical protein